MSATAGHAQRPVRYVGVSGIAAWFHVGSTTVSKWLTRYDDWPVPDAVIEPGRRGEPDRGWLPEREQEWRDWKASLPGQGAPGRPKPRRAGQGADDGGDAGRAAAGLAETSQMPSLG